MITIPLYMKFCDRKSCNFYVNYKYISFLSWRMLDFVDESKPWCLFLFLITVFKKRKHTMYIDYFKVKKKRQHSSFVQNGEILFFSSFLKIYNDELQ